jgi:asparagine N-glycosylation enzyme membrane subunit Stt3
MLKRHVVLLALVCLFALGLRLLSYNNVFGGSYVSFLEVDAYNRMYYAKLIAGMPFLDAVSFSFTQGSMLFPGLVAALSGIFPIEHVGAWLPPILGTLTVLIVYAIGAKLFNRTVGYIGAIFTAVIPSEFLHRTQLGFADHHALEICLMMLTVYLLIVALKSERRIFLWAAASGLSLFLYIASWKSGLVMGAIMGLYAVYGLFRADRRRTVGVMVVSLLVMAAIWIPTGGYRYFMGFFPHSADLPMQAYTAQEVIDTALTAPADVTIGELRPIFAPSGAFNPAVVVVNFHFFIISFIIGAALLWLYRKDKAVVFFTIWTLVIIAMTLAQRRFAYYATIPIGVLSAYAVYEAASRFKVNRSFAAAILAVPFILLSLPFAANITKFTSYQMSVEWHDALGWLSTQQVSGHVTAWGDYGHWIKYETGFEPNLLPGPGGGQVAQLLLSNDAMVSRQLMDTLDTNYLIVDTTLATSKRYALSLVSGNQTPEKETLLYRLLYRNDPQPYLTMVYESATIKIFEYEGDN